MSALDIYGVPVAVFTLTIVLLSIYMVMDYFFETASSFFAFNTTEGQDLYSKFQDVGHEGISVIDMGSLAFVFGIIITSGILAFFIKSHPIFFPIFVFIGAIVLYIWKYLYSVLYEYIITSPYFSELVWLPVIIQNMPALISISTGLILAALYLKPATAVVER